MTEQANAVLKSVPTGPNTDESVLERIANRYKALVEAEGEAATAETEWANAKKAMLDETTTAKEEMDVRLENASKANGKNSAHHLKSILEAHAERKAIIEEHSAIVAEKNDAKKAAQKAATEADRQLREAIENSGQGSLFDDE